MAGLDPHPERNVVYRLITLPLRLKVVLFLGGSLVCAALSLALHPALGAGSGLFALYLAAFSGLLFGVYGGLAGGALAILLQAWMTLMSHGGELSPDQQRWALTGSLLLGLTGGLFGYMASLTGRYVVELQKRIQADRELLGQWRQFRQLLDHAGEGIFLIDEAGRVVEWNPRMADLTGLAAEQALDQPGAQVWAASGLKPPVENLADRLAQTQQTGQAPWNNRLEEIQMLSPDGQARFVQSLSFIIETDHGYQIGGILRDTTELKQAEINQAEQRIFSQALQQTAGALTSSLRLDEVLDAMLDTLQVVVPHDAALILMVSGDCAHVERSRNFSSEEFTPRSLSIDQTKNLRLMRAMQLPYRIANVHQDPNWIKAHGGMLHLHAYLGAPILVADEVVGFISLFKKEADFFTGQHLERLQTFAAQTGVAVRNARLFEAAQWRSRQLDRLTELTRLALTGDSFDDILSTLIATIGELFEADQAF
ncbi:MAG TPA: GAF domain-containing protein, partial [Anaerolineales bacterium]|nr:GAF domain-containing protein [Anaerolineales bacterium]